MSSVLTDTSSLRDVPELELTVPARPDQVAAVRRAVEAFAARVGIDGDQRADVILAVGEACANAVMHAYLGEGGSPQLLVRGMALDEGILITVRDHGRGMVPRPDSPGLGLGLPLMARLATSMEVHQPAGGGTEIRMTFGGPESRDSDLSVA